LRALRLCCHACRLTALYGEHSWALVATALGCSRSNKQCRERWVLIRPGARALTADVACN
jgi:hypothetical protein